MIVVQHGCRRVHRAHFALILPLELKDLFILKQRPKIIPIIKISGTDFADVVKFTMHTKKKGQCFNVWDWQPRKMADVERIGGILSVSWVLDETGQPGGIWSSVQML